VCRSRLWFRAILATSTLASATDGCVIANDESHRHHFGSAQPPPRYWPPPRRWRRCGRPPIRQTSRAVSVAEQASAFRMPTGMLANTWVHGDRRGDFDPQRQTDFQTCGISGTKLFGFVSPGEQRFFHPRFGQSPVGCGDENRIGGVGDQAVDLIVTAGSTTPCSTVT